MILSHYHRFIFIKGRKTGSTTAEVALSSVCGDNDIITPITPIDEKFRMMKGRRAQNFGATEAQEKKIWESLRSENPDVYSTALAGEQDFKYYNHMPLSEVIHLSPTNLEGYRVIATERSPYSKVMSLANFKAHFAAYRRGKEMRPDLKRLSERIGKLIDSGKALSVKNLDLYRDRDGKVNVKFLRQSNLAEDLKDFALRLDPNVAFQVPHLKKGGSFHSSQALEFFSKEQISYINHHFADEFEVYGYEQL